jgi:23S rRNA pseudouridine1911/1915/1917 synthase
MPPKSDTFETRILIVDDAHDGSTVQRFLHDEVGLTHSRARGMIRAGAVSLDGRSVSKPDERLATGDRVGIRRDPRVRYDVPRRPHRTHGYRIVHEDPAFIVVDKQPGLITVPSPHHHRESLLEALADHYRARGFKMSRMRAAHRIDRYTSGLVVVARNERAHTELRRQFAAGLPERVYLAVVEGRVAPDEGRLVHYLAEHPVSLKVHAVREGRQGRRASCRYCVLERFAHASLVEVKLETGRRNQIRVQFAEAGHPLVGDLSYGRASHLIARTALHAARLAFDPPGAGGRLVFRSEMPGDFRSLVAALRRGADPGGEGGADRGGSPEGHRVTRQRGRARRYTSARD